MKTLKIISIVFGVVIVVLLGVLIFWKPVQGPTKTPTEPVTHQVVFSPDGSIGITMPGLDATVTSPIGIEGQAAGTWFFEASFPIKILDADGTVLGQGSAQALGDWMTTGTVAFSANIPFTTPKYATGTIVFSNANPSGAPANAKQFRFVVRFQ